MSSTPSAKHTLACWAFEPGGVRGIISSFQELAQGVLALCARVQTLLQYWAR